jgi:SAM-dependent methyltransferase
MNKVPGTQAYAEVPSAFTRVCESIDFYSLHGCIVDLNPELSSRILDVGAGTGRDAAALAEMGHNVVAVEPTTEFINTAKEIRRSHTIQRVSDSLPNLESLGSRPSLNGRGWLSQRARSVTAWILLRAHRQDEARSSSPTSHNECHSR